MASKKDDRFTRCFADFVRYLNVVEPFDHQYGFLECRIGFLSRDTGELTYWMQDLLVRSDDFDKTRFNRMCQRVSSLVKDLNTCRSFVDEKIVHTFDLFDQDGKLRYEVLGRG